MIMRFIALAKRFLLRMLPIIHTFREFLERPLIDKRVNQSEFEQHPRQVYLISAHVVRLSTAGCPSTFTRPLT